MRTSYSLTCLFLTFFLFPVVLFSQVGDHHDQPFKSKWVSSVVFEGNKNFSDNELLGLFEKDEKVGGLVNTLFVYRHDQRYLEFSIADEVRKFYRSHGYIDTKILPLKFAVEGEDVRIVVHIEEGRVYRFGQVRISELDDKSKEKEILDILHLGTGEIADITLLRKRAGEVRTYFANKGYAACDLEFEPTLNPPADPISSGEGTMDLDFYVEIGPIYRFGEITNFGKAPSPAISNLLTFKQGDLFNQSKIDETVRILNDSNLFNEINPDSDVEINKIPTTVDEKSEQGVRTEAVLNSNSEVQPVSDGATNDDEQLTGVVSIDMKIKELGPPKFYFLDSVRFVGNKSISDDELKQQLGLDYTGLFDPKPFLERLREFNQTGRLRPIIEDDIEIQVGEPGEEDDEVRSDLFLTIKVRELALPPNPHKRAESGINSLAPSRDHSAFPAVSPAY